MVVTLPEIYLKNVYIKRFQNSREFQQQQLKSLIFSPFFLLFTTIYSKGREGINNSQRQQQ